jgi:hypothetical protein
LAGKIFNANGAVYLAVLVWWIVCLWIDEPGTTAAGEIPADAASEKAKTEAVEISADGKIKEDQ